MTRHRLDLFSLLSGLVLIGIALAALFGVSLDVAAWVWPTILIAVGVVVIGSVVASNVSTEGEELVDNDGEDSERTEAMAAARQEVAEAE